MFAAPTFSTPTHAPAFRDIPRRPLPTGLEIDPSETPWLRDLRLVVRPAHQTLPGVGAAVPCGKPRRNSPRRPGPSDDRLPHPAITGGGDARRAGTLPPTAGTAGGRSAARAPLPASAGRPGVPVSSWFVALAGHGSGRGVRAIGRTATQCTVSTGTAGRSAAAGTDAAITARCQPPAAANVLAVDADGAVGGSARRVFHRAHRPVGARGRAAARAPAMFLGTRRGCPYAGHRRQSRLSATVRSTRHGTRCADDAHRHLAGLGSSPASSGPAGRCAPVAVGAAAATGATSGGASGVCAAARWRVLHDAHGYTGRRAVAAHRRPESQRDGRGGVGRRAHLLRRPRRPALGTRGGRAAGREFVGRVGHARPRLGRVRAHLHLPRAGGPGADRALGESGVSASAAVYVDAAASAVWIGSRLARYAKTAPGGHALVHWAPPT
eukprot:ctg_71.g12